MPVIYKQLHKIARSLGYQKVSQKGSHVKYRKEADTIIIPEHKEIKKWLAHKLTKSFALASGISHQEFLKQYKISL